MTKECDLCYREISEQEGPALCDTCKRTCKAHARVIKNNKEWEEEGSP